ncbi:MFS transporter [Burkholderia pseudomultivorans]|uniref:MFS transporter n=2 Tax=Burkholderia pseudomultivorans TaxID=1207504 RepID=A0A6P2RF44_9BURK|nr:MFS transporter [Burkholderia pseudomultivorans]
MRAKTTDPAEGAAARQAMRFVVLIGVLSFFADCTYEGARGILGPFLAQAGATATIIGVVMGLGELLGYGLRLVSGTLADVTRRFWTITIIGYLLQMSVVPMLALTHTWQQASVLVVLERVGKAIRNPPRDVMLSHAAQQVGGYGWVFGLHEAFDQFGAMIGPLVVAAMMARGGSYRQAFAVLAIPAVCNLGILILARVTFPGSGVPVAGDANAGRRASFPRRFWIYLIGAGLVAAGFADYPLIAYHFTRHGTLPVNWIPAFYAVAMGVSGGASLALGRLFDRYGMRVLIGLTILCAAFAPCAFLADNFELALFGVALWGMGIGVHESIIPAAVAPMVPGARRASAFGLFTSIYGVCWFIGSAAIGWLYDRSVASTVIFCVATQLLAVPFFIGALSKASTD